jgi:energy-coupling factor transporter ATP-binding protein EcfA2
MAVPQTSSDPFIILEDVVYSYPKGPGAAILDSIHAQIHPGKYLLISGASGSGKSTLARTFNGLIPHFYGGHLSGRVTVDGRAIRDCNVAQLFHQVGLVAQNPRAQLFNRTVTQELAFGLESLGIPRMSMQARIAALVSELGIAALLDRNPQTLSGGEQQLVAIAAILVTRPQIVVLDEPLANLDPAHVKRLRDLLERLRREGIGIVVCEHRMVPTLPDADAVMVLRQGRLFIYGQTCPALSDPRWADSCVELPLCVRIGARSGMRPLPRSMDQIPPPAMDTLEWDQELFPATKSNATGAVTLKTENLSYKIGDRTIVNGVDMTLYAGQCAAIVGANGAGKTTLLRLINGLLRPSGGHVRVNGCDSTRQPAWQTARAVGTAFQNPNSQFFKLTVGEELAVGPRALKCYDANWIDELIALFKLDHLIERAPFKLSGGEKKRVAFAAALASKPSLLLLDEPTAGQDTLFRSALAGVLERLCSQGTAILIVTHALNFAESVAPHWMVMAQGRITVQGTPQRIMSDRAILEQAGLEPTERYILWEKSRLARRCG